AFALRLRRNRPHRDDRVRSSARSQAGGRRHRRPVWGMARTLCPDRERASIALVAALIILLSSSSIAQIGAIVFGAIAGLWLCRAPASTASEPSQAWVPLSRRAGLLALATFFLLLFGLPIVRSLTHSQAVALFEAFYRSGALVFGGGHVV